MGRTSIEWADFTVNPIRARHRVTGRVGHYCEKTSPGCTRCYSSAWQEFRGTGCAFEAKHRDEVEVYFEPRALDEVLRRRIPTRWFWCDMTDVFGAWVPDAWLDHCFAMMALTPRHTHLVLTKRAEPMRRHFSDPAFAKRVKHAAAALWDATPRIRPYGLPTYLPRPWPLLNVHLGVSVEDRKNLDRLDLLRQTPAAVRFVSFEPLLEDLGDVDLTGIDQAIYGGESDPQSRPCDLAWIRRGIACCRKSGTAAFFKQAGSRAILDGAALQLKDRKGGDLEELPEEFRVREYPHAL